MRRVSVGLLSLALASGLGVSAGPSTAVASPPAGAPPPSAATAKTAASTPVDHELPNALEDKRRALKEEALTAVLNGTAKPERRGGSSVVKVGQTLAAAVDDQSQRRARATRKKKDQYVELSNERTDKVFVFLVDFGNTRHPDYPDRDTNPATEGPARFNGPGYNEIPQPGPQDNSTQWRPDFDREYYEGLYFGEGRGVESLKTYYERQSSGRYSVEGLVTDMTTVRYNQARYGRSTDNPNDANGDDPAVCASIVCSNTWALVRDGVNQWVADRKAAGDSDAQIAQRLAEYDVVDRYDYDGDGDFNERDGYLDKFQIVHSGGDEADGDPLYGEDAIWSHRWYAYGTDIGRTGPAYNQVGGTQIGKTGLWVGDYTIQPENGGLSVVAHEYGHDLGLPDHYDTAASGDNPVSWWTLMAQSRVSARGDQGIGTRAADLGAWDKLQLGWLDYETAVAGQRKKIELGPHEYNTRNAQGVVVVLPKKEIVTDLGAPFAGSRQFYSGTGDNLDSTMSRRLDLTGASTARLTFKGRWDIETDYDYLYVQTSLDGGQSWTSLDGTVGGQPFVRDASGTPAISDTQESWADVVVPMNAAAGRSVDFRFLYRTDGAVAGNEADLVDGFFADNIVVTKGSTTVLSDGAESSSGWTYADGFGIVGASVTAEYDNYYIASNRAYVSYDRYLQTGPYNFGTPSRPDFAEHFPYQDGLLISYWDTSYSDNNTSVHPGAGLILPIDSHPEPIYNLTGQPWRGRIQTYDSTFSRQRADSFTLNVDGRPNYIRGGAAQPVFDDRRSYFSEVQPRVGVTVPNNGVRIVVDKQRGTSMTIRITSTR